MVNKYEQLKIYELVNSKFSKNNLMMYSSTNQCKIIDLHTWKFQLLYLNINGKIYNTLHFNFSSTDKKLNKDKKLNTDVWYDEKALDWLKATFKKKGDWEYKLSLVK